MSPCFRFPTKKPFTSTSISMITAPCSKRDSFQSSLDEVSCQRPLIMRIGRLSEEALLGRAFRKLVFVCLLRRRLKVLGEEEELPWKDDLDVDGVLEEAEPREGGPRDDGRLEVGADRVERPGADGRWRDLLPLVEDLASDAALRPSRALRERAGRSSSSRREERLRRLRARRSS